MLRNATHTNKPDGLMESRRFCHNLFLDDPGMSIDSAARLINENCTYGLIKSDIARIRQEVQRKIQDGGNRQYVSVPTNRREFVRVRQERAPFNPPHFKVEEKKEPEEAPMASQPQATPSSSTPTAQGFPYSTTAERSIWLSSWAEKNPNARIQDAREALIKQFGIAIGTAHIAETLKLAREVRAVETPAPQAVPQPTEPLKGVATESNIRHLPTQQEIEEVVQKCRTLGISAIHLNGPSYRVEVGGTLSAASM